MLITYDLQLITYTLKHMIKNALWLFGITAFVLVFFFPSFVKLQDLRKKNNQHEAELQRLRKEYKELAEEKRKLETDPAYFEKVAREKMGLVRDGEVIYRIMPAEKKKK